MKKSVRLPKDLFAAWSLPKTALYRTSFAFGFLLCLLLEMCILFCLFLLQYWKTCILALPIRKGSGPLISLAPNSTRNSLPCTKYLCTLQLCRTAGRRGYRKSRLRPVSSDRNCNVRSAAAAMTRFDHRPTPFHDGPRFP